MALVGAVYGFDFLTGFISQGRPWLEELGFPLTVGAAPGALSAFLCARLLYGKSRGRGASGGDAPQAAMQ
jgi:hypothetical protein